jgi:hypothetical protein
MTRFCVVAAAMLLAIAPALELDGQVVPPRADHGQHFVVQLIPMTERHLRAILRERIRHYNRGRPCEFGSGIPERLRDDKIGDSGHRLPTGHRVAATAILGGLHHEYRLEKKAA